MEIVHSKEKVAYRPQACVVCFGTVIDNGYWFGVTALCFPLFKDVGKLMVGDDDVFVYLRYGVDVVEHPSEDGTVANLKKWLGEVSCQFSKTRGIACRYNNVLHVVSGVILGSKGS